MIYFSVKKPAARALLPRWELAGVLWDGLRLVAKAMMAIVKCVKP